MTLQRPSCDAGTPRSLHDRHDLHCYTADVQVRRRRLLHAEAARRRAAWGWCVAREAHEKLQADGDEMLTNAAKLLLRFCSVCCAGSAKPFGKACLSVWYALFSSPPQPLRKSLEHCPCTVGERLEVPGPDQNWRSGWKCSLGG